MKKSIILIFIFFCAFSFAQNKKDNLSPEQKSTLITKRMSLRLDLSDSQEKEVYDLFLARIKNKQRNTTKKELTPDQKYERRLNRINQAIALKRAMKKILSEEQYKKFEKTHFQRKKKRMRKHKSGIDHK